ncbi:hypothetical protein ABS771_17385 [Methylobacterium brachiatum]|uniref:Uncharacterized protein n=1 Tax=Methylobacterium brachiatum TaxID=269660 RepID=A0ABV1R6W5_9HYPH
MPVLSDALTHCIARDLFDDSPIKADANKQKKVGGSASLPPELMSCAAHGTSPVPRGHLRGHDAGAAELPLPDVPGVCATGARGGQAFFTWTASFLIDFDHAIVFDVKDTTTIWQAEVTEGKRMNERSYERFDLYPA